MNLFSISQLAQFSGIKPHTIRIWEQRYDALKPQRSEGNTRFYDNSQLRRLLNIVSLMGTSYKVWELCSMSDGDLKNLIVEENRKDIQEPYEFSISQLISAGMYYDEIAFDDIFSQCVSHFGVEKTYINVLYPMLVRIGLLWSADKLPPPHEHFISNLIRQKLFSAIDALPLAAADADRWLLFLPEGDFHEIGLLFANYLIRQAGRKSLFLGGNLPLESAREAVEDGRPTHILLFIVHYDVPQSVENYLTGVSRDFTGSKIFIAGNEKLIEKLKPVHNVHWLKTANHLRQELFEVEA